MSTTFFLHGGGLFKEENNLLYSDIHKETLNFKSINILLILFAKEEKNRDKEEKIIIHSHIIKYLSKIKKVNITIASNNSTIFSNQIKNAKLIFTRGGDHNLLLNALKRVNFNITQLRDKIIIGESAGVNVFAKICYSLDYKRVIFGLGILKCKTHCHFVQEKHDNHINILESKAKNLISFYIPNGEYIKLKQYLV